MNKFRFLRYVNPIGNTFYRTERFNPMVGFYETVSGSVTSDGAEARKYYDNIVASNGCDTQVEILSEKEVK